MTRRRLFLALMPGPRVQADIRQHMSRWHWPPGLRTTPPERLHLTLHFLGDVEAAHEAALVAALPCVNAGPIDLQLDAAQVWNNGVAVLQPRYSRALAGLHADLGQLIGIPAAKEWKPHVTLARNAGSAFPPEAMPPVRWTARRFFLVWSQLGPVTRYHVLWASARTPPGERPSE